MAICGEPARVCATQGGSCNSSTLQANGFVECFPFLFFLRVSGTKEEILNI